MMKWLKLARFFLTAPGWLKASLLVLLIPVVVLGLILAPVLGLLLLVLAVPAALVALVVLPARRLVKHIT